MRELQAIIRKELTEIRRLGIWSPVASVGPALSSQLFMVYMAVQQSPPGPDMPRSLFLRQVVTYSMALLPAMTIMNFCNIHLGRTLTIERTKGSMAEMLSTGVAPGIIWSGKILASFAAAYVYSLAGVVLSAAISTLAFDVAVVWTTSAWSTILILTPMWTLILSAWISFCQFIGNKAMGMLASFTPAVLFLGVFTSGGRKLLEMLMVNQQSPVVSLLSLACGLIATFCLLTMLANRSSRTRILGL